jgi:two-component system, LytTR family, sensor kinase
LRLIRLFRRSVGSFGGVVPFFVTFGLTIKKAIFATQMQSKKPYQSFSLDRTSIITWLVSATIILLMNTNFTTGVVRWDWTVAILSAAVLIGKIQERVVPGLMQETNGWSTQRIIASYALVTVGIAMTVSSITLFIMQSIKGKTYGVSAYFSNGLMFTLFTMAMTSVYVIQSIINNLKMKLLREQELKQALLKAEFDTLKNQVNPHFLFNSLNILSALIPEDPENAVNLVEKLSKVFRYNLQNNDRVTVEVGTELKIVESYLFIHKMRFGDNLHYTIDVPKEELQLPIVTQGLLTLIENAVKHNECSREFPLRINVFSENGGIIVQNNFQPKNKQFLESTGIGLSNLKSRYALLGNKQIEVKQTEAVFEVKVPFV